MKNAHTHHIHEHTHAHIHTNTNTRTHAHIHKKTHARMHTHKDTAHTHTHTHTHTHKDSLNTLQLFWGKLLVSPMFLLSELLTFRFQHWASDSNADHTNGPTARPGRALSSRYGGRIVLLHLPDNHCATGQLRGGCQGAGRARRCEYVASPTKNSS